MRLREILVPEFDLGMTLNCGQVFHWQKHGRGFTGAIAETPTYVEQEGHLVRFAGIDAKELAHYFAFDHLLTEICASFPKDAALQTARQFCRGLRIIRQPKWECLATFICSSMKQLGHIRQISLSLRKRFGTARKICGQQVLLFPPAERIADASEKELQESALGYRAKNLRATAQQIASGAVDLASWSGLSDLELHDRLCALPGVGTKVANCVMLFAYERIGAFPIDVWIERVLREKYFAQRQSATKKELAKFASGYFGAYGGYAQQYLFHYARTAGKQKREDSSSVSRC
jgi:3-methyladenine DNA glycosylase/8-oxoguanine DNA glycosylase